MHGCKPTAKQGKIHTKWHEIYELQKAKNSFNTIGIKFHHVQVPKSFQM